MNSFDQLYIEFLIVLIFYLMYKLYKCYNIDEEKENELKKKSYSYMEHKGDKIYFASDHDINHPDHPTKKLATHYDVEKMIKLREKDKKVLSHKKLLKGIKNGLISGGLLGLVMSGPHGVVVHGIMMGAISPIIMIAKHNDLF